MAMKLSKKKIEVLKFLYENRPSSVHYDKLKDIIFSNETVLKYKSYGDIDRMTCLYLGKLAKTYYIQAEYKAHHKYTYFIGYYITDAGVKYLIDNNLV